MIRKITEGFSPKHYLVEFILGLTALFGFYLIIAWSSYSPFDSTWSVSAYQTEIINKAGKLGAWVVDLFFTFFGDVGHILPFLVCITPIYFIRTKRADSLTWTRFCLRMFGFVTFMLGATALCALLLNNTPYHLAGGVLGGSLVKHLFPVMGKFGILLFGVALTVLGFVFCSGASLIRLLVAFYNWLTMKNEEPAQPEQVQKNDEEYSEAAATEGADAESGEIATAVPADDASPIHISGLDSSQAEQENAGNMDMLEKFDAYDLSADQNLPHVSIAHDDYCYGDYSQEVRKADEDMPLNEQELQPEFIKNGAANTVGARDIFMPGSSDSVHIPAVKLAPSTDTSPVVHPLSSAGVLEPVEVAGKIETKPTALFEQIEDESDDDAELAAQFARQEAAREQARQAKAQEMGISLTAQETEEESSSGLRTISIDQAIVLFGDHKSPEKPTTDMPSLDLLDRHSSQTVNVTETELRATSQRIEQRLRDFNVKATVKDVLVGPVVTRYELELQPGVKASKVTSIDTDLARALTFKAVRVAETIPGKPYIGIETPNAKRQNVYLRDVLESETFRNSTALLPMALGKDISGKPVVIDLAKTPHLLVAGSTGSGKSVGINTMILSLLYRVKPEEVKFIMIDPKVVELSVYNGIPHLLTEVVTDMKKAANALRWCVDEMDRRYQLLAKLRVRSLEGFNERIDAYRAEGVVIPDPLWTPSDSMDTTPPILERLNYIVLIVDEFADLMMVAGKQIEELIARLTQKARAVGIHVILATQRPSVDVITGLIKSNIPSRIAFTVVQRNDSRTILDQNGAEALLGRGDMLYLANGTTELMRVHGAFMTDDEVNRVADDWRARGKPDYIASILENSGDEDSDNEGGYASSESDDLDPLFDKAVEIVSSTGMTSTSFIQRRLKVGFNRAANIMEQMEEQGIVSEMRNGKRELLVRNTSSDY
ncbi:DNA translocase FtsK [Actinobacillus succinogenes]|uniref:DNA translocase FtsK n=1 Tax=Actinobacillus succinogenes (strain ATCC 55618 / DSM 22257 / CCUG 43843 / 130Z) TaxID=339671 RepID=A6VNB9_ACTSZ|nr:DNA translocase FtsK [Actinobacillus succinogenes]ABR74466.1 cell divisionFtsK/SpoIIIE [Actinobacillus succinogenes 130Z]PHI41114.1 DNA translocase FtsK [Actinobacillus succinogenes]